MSMTKEMTTGKPYKLILSFALPMIFGNVFQQLYNMVDTIIVGKYVGVDALAAVGSTGAINFLVIGFALGICSGFSGGSKLWCRESLTNAKICGKLYLFKRYCVYYTDCFNYASDRTDSTYNKHS